MAPTGSSCEELKKRLERKATFNVALQELASVCEQAAHATEVSSVWPCIVRSHGLLKTRYSNVAYWKAGKKCFEAAQAVPGLDPGQTQQLIAFLADAAEFLGDEAGHPPASATTRRPSDPADSTMTDAGLVFSEPQPAPPPAAPSSTSTAAAPVAAAAPDTTATTTTTTQDHMGDLHRDILAAMQQMYEGMDAVTRGTEASISEIDNVLGLMRAQLQQHLADPPPRAPPASKRLWATLPRYMLTQAKLDELGAGRACPVCTDDLTVGHEVIVLPCSHVYHPACLQPWFKQHNSCPTCRQEVPTDDPVYEAKKEQRQEEEESARGAANALSHNEFMYI